MLDPGTIGVLGFAAGAGVTTFFAPCAFPLLPGYVGYYLRESDQRVAAVPAAATASAGTLAALALVGGLVLALGRSLTRALPLFEPVVGVALVVFGVLTLRGGELGVDVRLPSRPDTLLGFGVFGAVYGIAAAGCVVPLFLGVVAQALALDGAASGLALGTYALGVAAPLAGVTLLAGAGVDVWRSVGGYTGRIKQAAGVVMIVAGLGQLYLAADLLGVL
ncbi:thiol:disulfide interchange protein [Halolamina pelagica]|uniref:Thiol:disulfide interchange protein n=1 Tax=Halolamina pelagica TaxID=699431 RepID=A0A0P7GS19_9EURY|nr:cytochrome c biogenesis protein CcdA [Halolamina pelagica]KPN32184.1 thiol:disulfide interchange protein [Halolamina pelagica]